jgi:WD40 repeat protein
MSAEGNVPPAPGYGGGLVAALIAAFVAAVIAFAAGFFLGARRTVLFAESPAHDGVAYALEGRCAAGRCQLLRIGRDMNSAKTVETLNGPDERADEIAWTPDGRRVGFVVNGYQLRLFDAHTGASLGALAIIDPDGFPTSRIARGVTFSSNGAAITFDNCPRDHSGCKPGILAIKP